MEELPLVSGSSSSSPHACSNQASTQRNACMAANSPKRHDVSHWTCCARTSTHRFRRATSGLAPSTSATNPHQKQSTNTGKPQHARAGTDLRAQGGAPRRHRELEGPNVLLWRQGGGVVPQPPGGTAEGIPLCQPHCVAAKHHRAGAGGTVQPGQRSRWGQGDTYTYTYADTHIHAQSS